MQDSQRKKKVRFSFVVHDPQAQEQDEVGLVDAISSEIKHSQISIEKQSHAVEKSISSYIVGMVKLTLGKKQSKQPQKSQNPQLNSKNQLPNKANKSKQRLLLTNEITPINIKYSKNDSSLYQQGQITIDSHFLTIQKVKISLEKIVKAKILPLQGINCKKSQRMLKFQISDLQKRITTLFLSANAENMPGKITQHFQLYADIILGKLFTYGIKQKQSKWRKQPHSLFQVNLNAFIFGKIYKKSQIRAKWKERYIVVKENGIYSYHDSIDKNPSFFIPADSIKYIWTRFQFIYQFLVIKVKHGLTQTEFGIPVFQYNKDVPNNWLYQFYRIINRKL